MRSQEEIYKELHETTMEIWVIASRLTFLKNKQLNLINEAAGPKLLRCPLCNFGSFNHKKLIDHVTNTHGMDKIREQLEQFTWTKEESVKYSGGTNV